MRLALGGLLLDPRVYRAQRDSPAGVQRALLVVIVVELLVGIAAWIGDVGEYLTQPDPQAVRDTLYNGLTRMPWFERLASSDPEFVALFEQVFANPAAFALAPAPLAGAFEIITAPLTGLVGWFIAGSIIHIAAKAFGGSGRYPQTLACTGVATGVNLLGVVQAVPYAETFPGGLVLSNLLLGLIANYVAVREAHGLTPWRSCWAVLIGPILVIVLLAALYCCIAFSLVGLAGSLIGGGGR